MKKARLEKLALERGHALVSISLNTHKVYPAYEQDEITLKNLLKQTESELTKSVDPPIARIILNSLINLVSELDLTRLSQSLHIFVSTETVYVHQSELEVLNNSVHIGKAFNIDHLLQENQLALKHLILVLTQKEVKLYAAQNESIQNEINAFGFPFSSEEHSHVIEKSNQKKIDNQIREYFNKIDKAVIKAHQETKLGCIVISTSDNYSKLKQVADIPSVYIGHSKLDYNKVSQHEIARQAIRNR